MMEKTKIYYHAYFSVDIIKRVLDQNFQDLTRNSYRIRRNNEIWEFDDAREFFAEYRKPHDTSTLRKSNGQLNLSIDYKKNSETTVVVKARTRGDAECVFELFEENYMASIEIDEKQAKPPLVYIGHGRSPLWRDLKDHLTDKHNYKIEAYETGARAGHTIRDILEEMATKSSFAILVMTGEDEGIDGKMNARPNVIHEIGLFQGKLGFSKAIILLEEGTGEFSNIHGMQQLRFSKGNIKEVFGDVLATLKREFDNKKI